MSNVCLTSCKQRRIPLLYKSTTLLIPLSAQILKPKSLVPAGKLLFPQIDKKLGERRISFKIILYFTPHNQCILNKGICCAFFKF